MPSRSAILRSRWESDLSERPVRHVVTLVSPDGRFGGPTQVALDLSAEQRRRGRDAQVFGGAAGYDDLPDHIGEVPVHLSRARSLMPRLGFASTVAPRLIRSVTADLVGNEVFHVHLARDLVTLPVALELRRRRLPYVIQTHGMLDASDRHLARVVDLLMTRRAVSSASTAFVLTEDERAEILRLSGGRTEPVMLENGVADEGPTASTVTRRGALFLGRLHPRKGAALFAAAVARLAADHPAGTFRIAGPDEGDLGNVERNLAARPGGSRVELLGPVPPAAVRGLMREAFVFVQPARREPFGMTILEAMSVGTPPILHSTSALSAAIVAADAGWTFETEDDLTLLLDRLLQDEPAVASAGRKARALASDRFSIEAVVDRLDGMYPDGA